jgi:hypothetical protein
LRTGTYSAIQAFTGSLRPNFFAACDYRGYAAALESGEFAAYDAATVPGRVGDIGNCASLARSAEASLAFPTGRGCGGGSGFVARLFVE